MSDASSFNFQQSTAGVASFSTSLGTLAVGDRIELIVTGQWVADGSSVTVTIGASVMSWGSFLLPFAEGTGLSVRVIITRTSATTIDAVGSLEPQRITNTLPPVQNLVADVAGTDPLTLAASISGAGSLLHAFDVRKWLA